jgi:hypothetical protein
MRCRIKFVLVSLFEDMTISDMLRIIISIQLNILSDRCRQIECFTSIIIARADTINGVI